MDKVAIQLILFWLPHCTLKLSLSATEKHPPLYELTFFKLRALLISTKSHKCKNGTMYISLETGIN